MRLPLRLWILLPCFLSACQSEQVQSQREISKLESTLEQTPQPETARALIDRYRAYSEQYPQDIELNARYLYRAAGLAYRMNRFSQAIELLNTAIRAYYAGSNTINNALLLGAIYEEKLRNDELAATVYQAAARAFPNSAKVQEALQSDWADLDRRLESLADRIFDPVDNRIDYRVANDFINSATIYAMLLPEEPASARWLFEAAETARSIRAFSKSLELYDWIVEHFPASREAPQALFLKGFTLDSDLNRFEEAGAVYRAFVAQYPSSEFADDAQFLLENLGKDEEEIIRSFEEKNQLVQCPSGFEPDLFAIEGIQRCASDAGLGFDAIDGGDVVQGARRPGQAVEKQVALAEFIDVRLDPVEGKSEVDLHGFVLRDIDHLLHLDGAQLVFVGQALLAASAGVTLDKHYLDEGDRLWVQGIKLHLAVNDALRGVHFLGKEQFEFDALDP